MIGADAKMSALSEAVTRQWHSLQVIWAASGIVAITPIDIGEQVLNAYAISHIAL